ncbi:putative uncharacterized hydrolase [Smittium mucronatum]|uniref:Uncharacterized hydrolase n=1 Tax=Smittium mucronatum TaxID=133383 RepID=A0A1R0GND4_9FUNG|nr:putative uncharacterized hydrolase [Smittium mucronatum]
MLNVAVPQLPGANQPFHFSHILTREFKFMKPDPEPLIHIASDWDLKPHEIAIVGDSADDIECGLNAGAITILLKNDVNTKLVDKAHYSISRLDDIINLI